ncbi:hypothetical protein ACA910_018628 [Epithemia clementina (nom. ined.)]
MIRYNSGSFGFALLFRLHGSAVFRSIFPALISTAIYAILLYTTDLEEDEDQIFDHPYPMGALIAALTFLLAFRANFSYNRYWEAFTAVHQMHSKWMDVGMDIAAFHLQSSKYDNSRPPAFGEHPELTCLERERERLNEPTMRELENRIDSIMAQQAEDCPEDAPGPSLRQQFKLFMNPKNRSNRSAIANRNLGDAVRQEEEEQKELRKLQKQKEDEMKRKQQAEAVAHRNGRGVASSLTGIMKGGHAKRASISKEKSVFQVIKTSNNPSNRAWEENQPPLLLQEGAHLLSLLSAVAMSTLRNDLEEADSPLIAFTPGAPWPHVDPDSYGADVRKDWTRTTHRSFTVLAYLLGISRTPASRTLYNAARPFRVIGGVSDAEIEVLQAARGPYAKVALCTMWLEEFCSREHLNGGMGAVGAPIVSRLFQFTSDGMMGYNQARKISYIPFPFPHAQITSLFVLVVIGLMPVLMLSYISEDAYGYVATFLTVMCFTGLHEVSRELENPFQNVPNDIPLNNFQAQFNEGLMQMFAGFHPDAYWEIQQQIEDESTRDQTSYPPTKERIEKIVSIKDPASSSDENGVQHVDQAPDAEVPSSQLLGSSFELTEFNDEHEIEKESKVDTL